MAPVTRWAPLSRPEPARSPPEVAVQYFTRAEWGHPYPADHGGYYIGVQRLKYLVQHHTPGQDPRTLNEAFEEVQQIYSGHVGQGWSDIGYTFLIWDSNIFEGRGFGWTGAHAPGANSISIGVAFIMDGRYRCPTEVEQDTFRELSAAAMTYGYLLQHHTLTGHRDWVATSCPGDLAYAHLDDYWHDESPTTPIITGEEPDMYDFAQRPGGIFPWDEGGINYSSWGGAVAFDFGDVKVGERIVVSSTTPEAGELVCNLIYPNGKQTPAKAARWGHPVQFVAEAAGFVTVLVSANGNGRARVVGRA